MYAPRPIIIRLGTPEEILSLELIKEFIGEDEDLDADQSNVLPVLRQAAIDQGEQITGIVWAAATYRIDGLRSAWLGAGFILPLAPVFSGDAGTGKAASGADVPVPSTAYSFTPSAIDFGRPWAELRPLSAWPEQALTLSVTCTAGWTAEELPDSLRGWALNRIAALYDTRTDLVDGVRAMYDAPRGHSVGLLDRWTVRDASYA